MRVLILSLVFLWSTLSHAVEIVQADCSGNWDALRECEKQFESTLLSKIPDLVARQDKELKLISIRGVNPPKILKDGEISYVVIAHYPDQKLTVIRLSGYEYYDMYAYHHLYGNYVQVHDKVAMSPSGRYFAGYNADLESDYGLNAISIYRLADWPTLVTSFRPTKFAINNATFTSDELIKLETSFYGDGFKLENGECELISTASIWQFKNMACATKTVNKTRNPTP